MSTYKKINLSEVKDSAPEFGMGEMGSAQFAREAIGAERIGPGRGPRDRTQGRRVLRPGDDA